MQAYLEQQSEAWQEARRNRIGSSDAPPIMGVSPYKTQRQLFDEKVFGKQQFKTAAMQRGIDLEPVARQAYIELTGIQVEPKVIIDERDWLIASLDGLSANGKQAVEIKCCGFKEYDDAKNGKVPEKYYPQFQHQAEVAKLDSVDYFPFHENNGIVIKVYRNDKYIKKMLELEYEFWKRLQELNPPDCCESDFKVMNSGEWHSKVINYRSIVKRLDEYQEMARRLREELIELADGHNCVGYGIKLQKVVRAGNVDYSQVPELKNVDLTKYRKEKIESWKITEV